MSLVKHGLVMLSVGVVQSSSQPAELLLYFVGDMRVVSLVWMSARLVWSSNVGSSCSAVVVAAFCAASTHHIFVDCVLQFGAGGPLHTGVSARAFRCRVIA